MKKLLNTVLNFFTYRYVITQRSDGIKYYYLGMKSRWTRDKNRAKKYIGKPSMFWISSHHLLEKL